MKGHLLVITSVVLLLAVMVTLNLNSAVWAKDDYKTDSNSFGMSDSTNRDINTKTNDNGNIQTSNNDGSSNCDSHPQCQKTLDNAMGMLNNLMKPTLP